jgi:methylenetetrahydrofolate--tRNA-(uracil-5-)-methyltransferase
MLGGLYRYLREADPRHFQPMNANFGLLDPLPGKIKKDRKKELVVERAQADFAVWLKASEIVSSGGAMANAHHKGTEDAEGSLSH